MAQAGVEVTVKGIENGYESIPTVTTLDEAGAELNDRAVTVHSIVTVNCCEIV